MESTQETIRLHVRPPRVVAAYDVGHDWRIGARASIRWLSQLWDGAGDVVLPVGDALPPVSVLRLLRAHDPDVVAYRPQLVGDLEDGALDEWAQTGFESPPSGTPEDVRARIRQAGDIPLGVWPPNKLMAWLQRWTAIQQPYGDVLPHSIHDGGVQDPLAAADAVSPSERRLILSLDFSQMSPNFALMVSFRVGEQSAGEHVIELPVEEEDLPALAELALKGLSSYTRWDVDAGWRQAGQTEPLADPLASLPFNTGLHGVGWMTPVVFRSPAVLVIGNSASDHAPRCSVRSNPRPGRLGGRRRHVSEART